MAERPNNHITGDKAIRKIADMLIPEEWTISIPDSDYGLDMLIEVVTNNKTTGKLFFIQSKGTTESSDAGQISYHINVNRIKDYGEIKLPVLFVYYSKSENKFWGRWMNSLYETLTEVEKKQETVTLHFSSSNEIDAKYLKRIGNEIELSITNRVAVYCENIPEQYNRFHSIVIDTARQYIGSDITDDNKLTCKTIGVSYEGALQNGCVSIICGNESIRVPINLNSFAFLYFHSIKREECPSCLLNIIYVIALYGAQTSSQATNYALSYPSQDALDIVPLGKWESLINRLPDEKIDKTSDLFETAVQNQYNELAQSIIFNIFIRTLHNETLQDLYRNLLSTYLSSVNNDETKGILSYNLANSIKHINVYESFALYIKATKYEPKYRDKYYWWQEVAGLLYIIGHYKYAEQFYRKARELNSQLCRSDISILISDCLICQGRIEEARDEELNYINNLDKIGELPTVVNLKTIVTEMMAEQGISIFDATYWYNQGVKASSCNRHKESLESFLFAWRLNDGDMEALVNAFISAFIIMDYVKMAMIITILREQASEEGYKCLISKILSGMALNDDTERVIDILKKIFFDSSKRN